MLCYCVTCVTSCSGLCSDAATQVIQWLCLWYSSVSFNIVPFVDMSKRVKWSGICITKKTTKHYLYRYLLFFERHFVYIHIKMSWSILVVKQFCSHLQNLVLTYGSMICQILLFTFKWCIFNNFHYSLTSFLVYLIPYVSVSTRFCKLKRNCLIGFNKKIIVSMLFETVSRPI